MIPIISDIIVQLNCRTHADYLALHPRIRTQTKPVEPVTVNIKNMCLPSMDLAECNNIALYRVLRDLNYKDEAYKKARQGDQVRIIKLINPHCTIGLMHITSSQPDIEI